MRSTELHGERRGWNLHLVGRVVCIGRIFLEVWIFRNVWNELQNFVTNHFAAATAKREDGVPHQDHAGARLVLVAYFVNPRLLDQFSGSQGAIGLVKYFDVCILQSHIWCLFLSFPSAPGSAPRSRATRPSKMGCVQGSYKLVRYCSEDAVCDFYFQATPRACGRQQLCKNVSAAPLR